MIHELKTLPRYYEAVKTGKKTFEVRKNDRGFKVGHKLQLREWEGKYTGKYLVVVVTYLLNDEVFCKEGFVIMGIKLVEEEGYNAFYD